MNAIPPLPPAPTSVLPAWLISELRSDHAGETGAVMIYAGILATCDDADIRAFAHRHQATEQEHLNLIEAVLPRHQRSRLLPIWRVAGWLTGALPGLCGRRAVYATIDSVETFVDHHYRQQIDRLDAEQNLPAIRAMLERCRADEVHHRDEARAATGTPGGIFTRLWCRMVRTGSETAVAAARRV